MTERLVQALVLLALVAMMVAGDYASDKEVRYLNQDLIELNRRLEECKAENDRLLSPKSIKHSRPNGRP